MLGWFELPEDSQPPEHIWLNDEALADHFARVREKYKSGNKGAEMEAVPQPELEQNELTAKYRKK